MAKRFSNSPEVAAGGLNRIVLGGRLDSRGSDRGLTVVVVVVKVLGAVVLVVVNTGRNEEPVREANCAGFAFGGCKSVRTTTGRRVVVVVVVVVNLVVVLLVVDLVVVLGTDLTVVLVAIVEVVVGTVFRMLSFLVKKLEKS